MGRLFFFVALILLTVTTNVISSFADDRISPVRGAISSYIIPNMERFAELSEQAKGNISSLCLAPSKASLDLAQESFRASLFGFGRIEFIRLGPMDKNNRGHRLLFWPDRKSTGLKQVQRALAQSDDSVTKVKNFNQKSVAVQGFGALEFLLFGSGFEKLSQNDATFRCHFARTIAENISILADALAIEWTDEKGFSKIWTQPTMNNDLFRSDIESLAGLVGMITNALEAIKDQRLKPVTLNQRRRANYKRALFWRSATTVGFLRANLIGIKDLISISGLMHQLPKNKRWIAGAVKFEFENALDTLSGLEGPVQAWVEDRDKAAKLSYLIIVVRSLQSLIGEQMAEALNLPTTFSPLDGD